MTREEIGALFTRREAAWRAHDAVGLAADHAPYGSVVSPTGGVLEGRPDIERIYRAWFTAFPDLIFSTEDLLIDGDRAALLARVSGRHTGEFFAMPATGRLYRAVVRVHLPSRGRPHRPRTARAGLHGPARPTGRSPRETGRGQRLTVRPPQVRSGRRD